MYNAVNNDDVGSVVTTCHYNGLPKFSCKYVQAVLVVLYYAQAILL